MRTYKDAKTNELMTLDQVRERFYKLAQKNPEEYDCISFNEYLKKEFEIFNMWYLVVGHNCDHKGTLIYKFFSEYLDAENYVKHEMGDIENVIVSHDRPRFSSENDYMVYEIRYIGDASTVLVFWNDDGENTTFAVTSCKNMSDAYRSIIHGMHPFLETNDNETDIWFHESCAGIDYGTDIYRWNILSVPFN